MSDSVMTGRQASAWLLTAMLAPLAHEAGAGWSSVALYAAILLPFWLLPRSFENLPRPILWLEWLTVILSAAAILPASGSYWPGSQSETAVPLVLLTLAAMTGTLHRSVNLGGILCWMTVLLGALIFYMSMQGVRLPWLRPAPIRWKRSLLLVLLLPGLSALWPVPCKKSFWGIALLGAVLGVLVQGNLSASAAETLRAPFYEMTRSLRLGSLTRLEPVGSVLLTLSWFALALYLLMSAKTLLERAKIPPNEALFACNIALFIALLLQEAAASDALSCAAAVLWFAVPFQNFEICRKKMKKGVDKIE